MPNEVVELEERICLIQKDISDIQRSLRDGEKEIKRITDKLENALAVLKLNKNNKHHIKQKAEVVDLKEFQNIKEKIDDLEEEVTDCNSQLSGFNKTRANLNSNLNLNNIILYQCQERLKTFCKVIPLNAKNE